MFTPKVLIFGVLLLSYNEFVIIDLCRRVWEEWTWKEQKNSNTRRWRRKKSKSMNTTNENRNALALNLWFNGKPDKLFCLIYRVFYVSVYVSISSGYANRSKCDNFDWKSTYLCTHDSNIDIQHTHTHTRIHKWHSKP